MTTKADKKALQKGKQTAEALIESINDAWEHTGMAGVVAVCDNFVNAAHSALLVAASPAALQSMGDELNALTIPMAAEMAKSNDAFKRSEVKKAAAKATFVPPSAEKVRKFNAKVEAATAAKRKR